MADALKMAVAVRGDKHRIPDLIFHSTRGSTYTATTFTTLHNKSGRASLRVGRIVFR